MPGRIIDALVAIHIHIARSRHDEVEPVNTDPAQYPLDLIVILVSLIEPLVGVESGHMMVTL